MKKANHGAISHYINIDRLCHVQYEDLSISSAEYNGTSAACLVALHYMELATNAAEFSSALRAPGTSLRAFMDKKAAEAQA